jgi:hypothetical protein
MKRDSKNLSAIFYLIKKKFIIETYDTFLEQKETEEINYSFGEKIIDRLLNDGNEEICFCLKYFIFTSEICIPINDSDISTQLVMAVDLLRDFGYFNSKKISLFELIMFSDLNYKNLNYNQGWSDNKRFKIIGPVIINKINYYIIKIVFVTKLATFHCF